MHYNAGVCRAIHEGGRRCSGCGYTAKSNGNRRSNRVARRKLVEHLIANGMPQAAHAILHAPPSAVQVVMAALDLDTNEVLGDTPPPSLHAMSAEVKARADELAAMAQAERDGTLGDAEEGIDVDAVIADAEAKVAAAEKHEDDLRKAANRATRKRRKLEKEYEAAIAAHQQGEVDDQGLQQNRIAYQDALAKENTAKADYAAAIKDTAAAKAGVIGDVYAAKKAGLTEDEFDAYCDTLSTEDVDAIKAAARAQHTDEVDAALSMSGTPAISDEQRDHSVYTSGQVTMLVDGKETTAEGRILDGGVAIVRDGYSDFKVLVDPSGDGVYQVVNVATGKSDALAKANRITQFTQVAKVTSPDNPTAEHVAAAKQKALVAGLTQQTMTGNAQAARQSLDKEMAEVTERVANGYGEAEVSDIEDGRRRHRTRVREENANQKAAAARAAALSQGSSKAQAEKEYQKAWRAAMGTETQGGGVIPHFEHKIPPDSLGQQQWTKLTHSGIRSFGSETAGDYSVIHERGGDLKKWGFPTNSSSPTHGSEIHTSNLASLTAQNKSFVSGILSQSERDALTTYTGGSYQAINAAITGRETNVQPHIKGVVGRLQTAFEKHEKYTPKLEPMTIMRGTKIPSGWSGTPGEYIDSVFKPGEKVQIGKVTSCTTNHSTASGFSGHPPYTMVIQTRRGIPVRSISSHKGED